MFFENEQNTLVLKNFIQRGNNQIPTAEVSENITQRLTRILQIITYIHQSPHAWDKSCTFNIKHIGEQFISSLSDYSFIEPDKLNNIYVMSYRFLCEFDFSLTNNKELSIDLRSVKNSIQNDNLEMAHDLQSQLIYASYIMPANITKEIINDEKIGLFKDYSEKVDNAKKLKSKWDEEIRAKEASVEALKEKLDEYETAFNFVGLYQGFSTLVTEKRKEACWLFYSLIIMGVFILSPLIIEASYTVIKLYNQESLDLNHLIIWLPVLSIEIILIYFFRIILLNHRSVKAQIMQIELRQTLCQFIQSYATYSSEIKKQDSSTLEKFENLIFSGILSDPEKLPSTFDGLEQMSNFLKNLKK